MDTHLPTRYTRAFAIALALSLLVHLLLGMGLAHALYTHSRETLGMGPAPEPLIINLQPDRKPEQRLIDTPVPVEAPPAVTDLIGEANSRAADMNPAEQGEHGPKADATGEIEQLGAAPPIPPAPAPAPPTGEKQQEREPETKEADTPEAQESPVQDPAVSAPAISEGKTAALQPRPMTRSRVRETPETQAQADPAKDVQLEPISPDEAGMLVPFEMAKANPAAPMLDATPRKTTGSTEDSAIGQGFTSFDAIRDEIAPYLKNIKTRVERQWRQGITMHYSGTQVTEAVVDCAIDAQGKVVSVKVVGTPDDRLFAAICEQAIERAGPFGTFTFQVPDMYRNKNLEIRWTFSFLR